MNPKTSDSPFKTIGFIGLGLIGGSIAKTIRRVYPEIRIKAYNRTEASSLEAFADGVIDECCDASFSGFRDCDLIFLCTPVVTALSFMEQLKPLLKENAILTDVGSVKAEIHRFSEKNGFEHCFIGGHPMAGSEKTGYQHSNDRIIENAWYILTPGGEVPTELIRSLSDFISALGALPLLMTYEEHDHVTAAVSHLPHVISAALVNLIHDSDDPAETMKTIAAGGFRDITRISSSSPQMWQEICEANSENICRMLDAFMQKLMDYRLAIGNEDQKKLLQIFSDCKEYRDSFDTDSRGPLKQNYRIYLDLADEAGSIARIAGILADADISIKNIGIVHNREFEQGVLRIEFYEDTALRSASELLKGRNYTVYE